MPEPALRRPGVPVLVALTLVAYGWWVTELRPFTWPSLLAVESAGLVAVTIGALRRRPRRTGGAMTRNFDRGGSSRATPVEVSPGAVPEPEARPGPRRGEWLAGLGIWLVLVAVLAGWELAAYLQHPRADHPTLSSLTDGVLAHQPLRALAFAGWVAGAHRLARR